VGFDRPWNRTGGWGVAFLAQRGAVPPCSHITAYKMDGGQILQSWSGRGTDTGAALSLLSTPGSRSRCIMLMWPSRHEALLGFWHCSCCIGSMRPDANRHGRGAFGTTSQPLHEPGEGRGGPTQPKAPGAE